MACKPKKRVKAGLVSIFCAYRQKCFERDRFWGISIEDFKKLTALPCYYCGKPPSNKCRDFLYSGLDRINNSKGYRKDNVVPCCKICNSVKGEHLSHDEMLAAMRAVTKLRSRR